MDGVLDVVLDSDGTGVGVTAAGPDVVVVVIAGREVVVGLGLAVVAVPGALEVVGFALVTVVADAAVVVVLSASPTVELVEASAGSSPPCPRLPADTSTAGLSP